LNVNVSPDSADLARFRCDSSLSDQFLTRLLTAGDRISQVGQHFNKLMDGQENWYMHFFMDHPLCTLLSFIAELQFVVRTCLLLFSGSSVLAHAL